MWLGSSKAWISPQPSIEIHEAIVDPQIGRIANSGFSLECGVCWFLLHSFRVPPPLSFCPLGGSLLMIQCDSVQQEQWQFLSQIALFMYISDL